MCLFCNQRKHALSSDIKLNRLHLTKNCRGLILCLFFSFHSKQCPQQNILFFTGCHWTGSSNRFSGQTLVCVIVGTRWTYPSSVHSYTKQKAAADLVFSLESFQRLVTCLQLVPGSTLEREPRSPISLPSAMSSFLCSGMWACTDYIFTWDLFVLFLFALRVQPIARFVEFMGRQAWEKREMVREGQGMGGSASEPFDKCLCLCLLKY